MAISRGSESSSGRSGVNAVAALVVVVAVMVGSAVSGAEAAFTISSSCDDTITVTTGAGNTSVGAGAAQSIVDTATEFFSGEVTVTVPGVGTIPVPTSIITEIVSLGNVVDVEIDCAPEGCITIKGTTEVPVVGPLAAVTLGSVCADT